MPNLWQRYCWQYRIWKSFLSSRMMILIAGPYRSGTGDDPEKLPANVRLMESFALPIFHLGIYQYWVNGLFFPF
jgi:hypothetical protein